MNKLSAKEVISDMLFRSSIRYFIIGYFVVILSLFLYSFTQVDLGLTLTRASWWQVLQKAFQSIGYFDRPLSTSFYIVILFSLVAFYAVFLRLAKQKRVSRQEVWFVLITLSAILTFSYTAFSYDVFNYIFDAKIVTYYNQNPYIHKALDFPHDPMLSFMHWIQRTYPYGPVWLAITVPISFVGLQFFLPTYFLFKMLSAVCFLGSVFFLSKIVRKIHPEKEVLSMIFFSMNPLVIIESLISSHNDIVMMFFSLVAFYFLTEKKYVAAILLLLASIGVKFATVFLLPIFLYQAFFSAKRTISWKKLFTISSLIMVIPIILSSYRTEMQPWYFLWMLPLLALIADTRVIVPSALFSFGLLTEYILFLYTGNWNPPIPTIKYSLIVGSLILSLLYLGFSTIKRKFTLNV